MVVVRCSILCSKFAKKSFVGRAQARWGSLQRSPRPPSWIMGEGRGRGRWKGMTGRERGREKEGKEGKGERGYPLRMKILTTALRSTPVV